ncbi:MAG: ABC transporter permease, partial [Nitrospiraceae bacterium]
TYLGGVFYSVHLLPPFWKTLSQFNPILYMVNAFRYGLLGVSDVPIATAIGLMAVFAIILGAASLHLLNRGTGLRQ